MGVEVATYISDLQPANPTSTDLVSQGDDHLRLLKTVLQASFPNASKAYYLTSSVSKVADFVVAATEQNRIFVVNAAGGTIIMTLPTLAVGDAGWTCWMVKSSNADANPIFINPPSGNLLSGQYLVARARRAIPGALIQITWLGSAFHVSRANALPVGSLVKHWGLSTPLGYTFPDGSTLTSASTLFPEYFSAIGSGLLPDTRGRAELTVDAGTGRLAGGIISGVAVGNTGGSDTVTLSLAQLPGGISSTNGAVALSASVTSNNWIASSVSDSTAVNPPSGGGGAGLACSLSGGLVSKVVSNGSATGSVTVTSTNTSGLAHSNLQPSIMLNEVVIIE